MRRTPASVVLCEGIGHHGALMTLRGRFIAVALLSISALLSAVLVMRWAMPAKENAGLRSQRQPLDSLGYLSTTPVAGEDKVRSGVSRYNPDRSWPGYNLVSMTTNEGAHLIDMHGEEVHQWRVDMGDYRWSDDLNQCVSKRDSQAVSGNMCGWSSVAMAPNGDVLAIVNEQFLVRVDWQSKAKWRLPIRAHHDLAVGANGTIYVLANGYEQVSLDGQEAAILNDYLVIVSPEGQEIDRLSMFDLFGTFIPNRDFAAAVADGELSALGKMGHGSKNPADVLHGNTVRFIDRDIPGFCEVGDLLISLRRLNMVALIDPKTRTVKWRWGRGELQGPHQPTLSKADNILIFDNGVISGRSRPRGRSFSRLVEVSPRSGQIVWEYKAKPPRSFFSHGRGASQELPNGNILVSDSDHGRAFEVTRDGEVVWEFSRDPERGRRGTFYRMDRIAPAVVEPLLSP